MTNMTVLDGLKMPVHIHFKLSTAFVVVVEFMRMVSMITSVLTVVILNKLNTKITVYKYIRFTTYSDLIYTGLLFLFRLLELRCTKNPAHGCPTIQYSYLLAYVWISDFFTSCLAFFNILMEIFIQLHRTLIVLNRLPAFKFISTCKWASLFMLIVSLLVYTPVLFMKRIELKPSDGYTTRPNEYHLVRTEFGKSKLSQLILDIINFVRIFLVIGVIFVLNLIIMIRFRLFLKKRRLDLNASGYHNSRATIIGSNRTSIASATNKNMTRMLVVIAFAYIVGYSPYSVYVLLKVRFDIVLSDFFVFSRIIYILFIIFKFFVYWYFNKHFRAQLASLFSG
jgi:hypothetical protein